MDEDTDIKTDVDTYAGVYEDACTHSWVKRKLAHPVHLFYLFSNILHTHSKKWHYHVKTTKEVGYN